MNKSMEYVFREEGAQNFHSLNLEAENRGNTMDFDLLSH